MKKSHKTAPKNWSTLIVIDVPRDPKHTVLMMGLRRKMTVKAAIENYLKHLKGRELSKAYIQQSKMVLGQLRKAHSLDPIYKLNRKEIASILRRDLKRVAPNTYAHYSRVYRLFFEFCKAEKYVLYNYVREFDLKWLKGKAFFDSFQLDVIFEKIPRGEIWDACSIIYHAGISVADLEEIEKPDFPNSQLVLSDRRVFCPYHALKIAERRRGFKAQRIADAFRDFIKTCNFKGNLRYLQNSGLMRMKMGGTPVEVIQKQLGFVNQKDVEDRLKHIFSISELDRELNRRNGFKDYY